MADQGDEGDISVHVSVNVDVADDDALHRPADRSVASASRGGEAETDRDRTAGSSGERIERRETERRRSDDTAGSDGPRGLERLSDEDDRPTAPIEDGPALAEDVGDAGGEPRSRARFEVYEDRAGEWRWRLKHANGNVLADSGQGYASRANAERGLESVRRNVPGAPVERLSTRPADRDDPTESDARGDGENE